MAPKLVQEIQGYKWRNITAGGVTLFASTYDPKEGDFMVGWGQGAGYGELALGAGTVRPFLLPRPSILTNRVQVKSATKPVRIDGFDGITILDIAGGQNTTFFIARPPPTSTTVPSPLDSPAPEVVSTPIVVTPSSGIDLSGFGYSFAPPAVVKPVEKLVLQPVVESLSRTQAEAWEELLRYPTVLDAVDQCQVCGIEDGPEESLECEMVSCVSWGAQSGADVVGRQCENAFHGACLTPPIVGVPEGESFLIVRRARSGADVARRRRVVLPQVLCRGRCRRGRGEGRSLGGQEEEGGAGGCGEKRWVPRERVHEGS